VDIVSGHGLTVALGGLFPGVVFYLSMVRVELFMVTKNLADMQTRSGINGLNASIVLPYSSRLPLSLVHLAVF
jgi:hypothetical protein